MFSLPNIPSPSSSAWDHCVRFNLQRGFHVDQQCRENFNADSVEGRRPSTRVPSNPALSLAAPKR